MSLEEDVPIVHIRITDPACPTRSQWKVKPAKTCESAFQHLFNMTHSQVKVYNNCSLALNHIPSIQSHSQLSARVTKHVGCRV